YQWYDRVLEAAAELETETRAQLTPAALDRVARAQFMLGERIYAQFEAIALEGDEEEVQQAILRKQAIGSEATALYERVFEFGRPGMAIGAFTRLGQLYHVFYEQVIDAPIPAGMAPLVEEEYRSMLEEQAALIKEEAIDRYSRAIQIARDSGWFNTYSDL